MAGTHGRLSPAAVKLALLVAAVTAASVLIVAYAVAALAEPIPLVPAAACGALIVAAQLLRLTVRMGNQGVAFAWQEAAVLLGVFLLAPAVLVVAAAIAAVIGQLMLRNALPKLLLNTSTTVTGAGAAALAYRSTADAWPGAVGELTGAAIAAITFTVICDLAVSAAIAISQDIRVRDIIADGLAVQALMMLGNAAVALGVVTLVRWEPELLLALPPLVVATHSAYRHRLAAKLERRTWAQLVDATSRLGTLHADEVRHRAATDLRELFRADGVVLHLEAEGSDLPHRHTGTADAGACTITRRLADASGVIGAVELLFRSKVTLTEREQATLSTYTAALASAFRNALLHQAQHHQATHDALTGLPNRTLLLEQATEALEVARYTSGSRTVGLLLLDLNHFKEINDTLGHDAGDQLLAALAARLDATCAEGDLVARLGGDEFAVLLRAVEAPEDADGRARRIADVLAEPVVVDGLPLSVEGSIGIALAGGAEETLPELLRRADVAMYRAKLAGTGVEHYTAEDDDRSVERLALLAELRRAMERGQLLPYYQPKVDLLSGRVTGLEALIRWNHPTRGLLSPGAFVPVIEATSLVTDFTLHVLELALRDSARWQQLGIAAPVAVNLSARTLIDPAMPSKVSALLDRYGVEPANLILEITETAALSGLDVVGSVLRALRGLGVALSVDDFGTGYSSLTFLSRTTLDELKIDQSFVSDITHSTSAAALVKAIIELAHSFDLRVVAEGIEHESERQLLIALGCRYGQGYHLAMPAPAADIEPLLHSAARQRDEAASGTMLVA